jgi:uncharacterized protein YndB with AHSA1/START domain
MTVADRILSLTRICNAPREQGHNALSAQDGLFRWSASANHTTVSLVTDSCGGHRESRFDLPGTALEWRGR